MAQNPIITKLDPGHIVKRVYDESSDKIRIENEYSSTATIINTPSISTTSVKLIDSNVNRKALFIYNNSANTIYICFGSPANSSNNITLPITTFTTYTMQYPIYTGAIYGIRNSGSGTCIITELT